MSDQQTVSGAVAKITGACPEWTYVDDELPAYRGVLACWLDAGHDGAHYDAADNLTWKRGKPGE